jgi:hypothetical protein
MKISTLLSLFLLIPILFHGIKIKSLTWSYIDSIEYGKNELRQIIRWHVHALHLRALKKKNISKNFYTFTSIDKEMDWCSLSATLNCLIKFKYLNFNAVLTF